MDNKDLNLALLTLMTKYAEIKYSGMQDRPFVIALREVLWYFRDNGVLKQAYKEQRQRLEDIKEQPFCKTFMAAMEAKLREEYPELPPLDYENAINNMTSDEYIDSKIAEILGSNDN